MRMPCVDAYHRQVDPLQLVPQPARHGARFETDPHGVGRPLGEKSGQCAGLGASLALEDNPAGFIDHAHRGLFLRHVQSNILLHDCSLRGHDI
jgi:hypothetical protein